MLLSQSLKMLANTKKLLRTASQVGIRARIDGERRPSDPPKLELQRNIPLKWVVDRFKVRDDSPPSADV